MTPNAGQQAALDAIDRWLGTPAQEHRLVGYAGTGKSTILRNLQGVADFAAPTGRAASRLPMGRTVHSLLYTPTANTKHKKSCVCKTHPQRDGRCVIPPMDLIGCVIVGCSCPTYMDWQKRIAGDEDLPSVIVVDEASMVNSEMYADILELGTKVIWAGDHGQLPPIGEDTQIALDNPDSVLTENERQKAGGPGGEIITLALAVRERGKAGLETIGSAARVLHKVPLKVDYVPDRLIICWKNRTRVGLNNQIRKRRGFKPGTLEIGDRVVCLRNIRNRDTRMMRAANGQSGTVVRVYDEDELTWTAAVHLDDRGVVDTFRMAKAQFGNEKTLNDDYASLWDHGYALTAHKSQGSEASEVLVVAEGAKIRGEACGALDPRWLYVAVTRAADKLTVVVP